MSGKRRKRRGYALMNACVGDGTCAETCPEVFEMRGDLAVVIKDDVLEEFEERCREAAEACPVEAIIIEE